MQSPDEDGVLDMTERTWSCRTESSKTLTQVLLRLCNHSARKDHECRVEVTKDSIVFLVTGKAKTAEGRAAFDAALFDDYFCSCDALSFSVNMNTLLDCLLLFGSTSDSTAAILTYSDNDAIFRLSLEDSGVLTTCDIFSLMQEDAEPQEVEEQDIGCSTLTSPDASSGHSGRNRFGRQGSINRSRGLHSYFRESPEACQLILKSEAMRETTQELSDVSNEGTVTVTVTPDTETVGSLSFRVSGVADTCEILFPSTAAIFVQFKTLDRAIEWKYGLGSFQLGLKAVDIATESFIRINEEGIMCIQHQIETSGGNEVFVDFLLLADIM